MKTVLVTGGAGFIGFHLCKDLAEDCEVTIIDNFSRSSEDKEFDDLINLPNVNFIKADITDKETFEALEDFDEIYHLAAINGTENFYTRPHEVVRVGILGTLNLLDWVGEKKTKILFSSSSEAYAGALNLMGDDFPIPTPENVPLVVDDPSNVRWSYGASKILSEVAFFSYKKAFNTDFRIIRYHNIYGPRMGFKHVVPQFIERIIKEEFPFKIFGADCTRSFCYVDDAVKATRLVMEKASSGSTVHIGRIDEIEILELARKLFEIAGVDPEVQIEKAPEGSVMRRCPEVKSLESLGFEANIALDEGLKKCYDWYKDKF